MKKNIARWGEKNGVFSLPLHSKIKKFISEVSLVVCLLLKNKTNILPPPNLFDPNLKISPVCCCFGQNIWKKISSQSSFVSIGFIEKIGFQACLRSKIGIHKNILKRMNYLYIQYFAQTAQIQEEIDGITFFYYLLSVGKNNRISPAHIMKMVHIYMENGLIPSNVSFQAFFALQEFYSLEEFLGRLGKIQTLLHLKKNIQGSEIEAIFCEYFSLLQIKQKEISQFFIVIVLGIFGVCGLLQGGKWNQK